MVGRKIWHLKILVNFGKIFWFHLAGNRGHLSIPRSEQPTSLRYHRRVALSIFSFWSTYHVCQPTFTQSVLPSVAGKSFFQFRGLIPQQFRFIHWIAHILSFSFFSSCQYRQLAWVITFTSLSRANRNVLKHVGSVDKSSLNRSNDRSLIFSNCYFFQFVWSLPI